MELQKKLDKKINERNYNNHEKTKEIRQKKLHMIKKINKRRRGQIVEEKKLLKKERGGKPTCAAPIFFFYSFIWSRTFSATPLHKGVGGERGLPSR